jgi:hypothetical protein
MVSISRTIFAAQQNRLAQGDKEDNRIPSGGTAGWEIVNIYGGYKTSVFGINAGLQIFSTRITVRMGPDKWRRKKFLDVPQLPVLIPEFKSNDRSRFRVYPNLTGICPAFFSSH